MRALSFLVASLSLACTPPDDSGAPDSLPGETGRDTAGPGETGDTGLPPPVDEDGDGAFSIATAPDLLLADCDDLDPWVGPDTERYIPPGPFVRGQDGDTFADPQREIELSGYCLQVTEVTVAAFIEFLQTQVDLGQVVVDDGWVLDLDGVVLYDLEDASGDDPIPEWITWDGERFAPYPGHEGYPVAEVTWFGADAYCRSVGLALPTEAQWEKGARGGCELAGDPATCDPGADDRTYPWGEAAPTCDLANYGIPIGQQGDTCMGGPVEVGLYPTGASPYGLLDMAGNEMEWVADWFQVDSYASDPSTDPLGPDEGFIQDPMGETLEDTKGVRGGCWLLGPDQLPTWSRFFDPTWGNSNSQGFRCARATGA
ncbi:MAG: SUMF1/EgtB/PvdO family nonheme iron enzyme [Pseudomonadota bacterium]